MILRIRLPDGTTERITISQAESLKDVGAKIEALDRLQGQFSLYSDIRFGSPFVFEKANHGDVIFVKGQRKPLPPSNITASPSETTPQSAPTPQSSDSSQPQPQPQTESQPQPQPQPQSGLSTPSIQPENEEPRRGRCRHGPRGMCENCMPKEDKRARYETELAKWKGRGTSVAVMEALDALKTKITAQPEPHATAVMVDKSAAENFQSYIATTSFQQQRIGICYGDVTPTGETRVMAIYEPPQSGSDQCYKLDDEGDMTQRADAVANLVGMQRVGIVFSARPRKCILAGMDVVFAARMSKPLTEKQRKGFVVLVVTTAETGETLFEAYQISDLAMQMYQGNIFEAQEKQKPNSGRVLCMEHVLVEGKDTKKVHTEFFLLNVPIKSYDSWLRTAFAVENREIAPQGLADLKRVLANDQIPYTQRITDFHVLLFLSNIFDMNTDMPGLLSAIKEGKDIGEGFRLMIDGIASSA